MFKLFVEGGVLYMGVLTVILIALFLAAWKAPAWVKEIGLLALVASVLFNLSGLMQAARAIAQAGDVSPALMWGGIYVCLISLIYGLLIYAASLIIRIIQKPRLP